MAGKPKSRLELRKQAEAAEAQGEPKAKTKRAKAAPKTTRAKRVKEKAVAKKRLIWVVYNGSMKEEARFTYDQYDQALEKIEQLKQKSKKLYFIHPLKEIIGEGGPIPVTIPDPIDDDVPKPRRRKSSDDDDDSDDEVEDMGDDE